MKPNIVVPVLKIEWMPPPPVLSDILDFIETLNRKIQEVMGVTHGAARRS